MVVFREYYMSDTVHTKSTVGSESNTILLRSGVVDYSKAVEDP